MFYKNVLDSFPIFLTFIEKTAVCVKLTLFNRKYGWNMERSIFFASNKSSVVVAFV